MSGSDKDRKKISTIKIVVMGMVYVILYSVVKGGLWKGDIWEEVLKEVRGQAMWKWGWSSVSDRKAMIAKALRKEHLKELQRGLKHVLKGTNSRIWGQGDGGIKDCRAEEKTYRAF